MKLKTNHLFIGHAIEPTFIDKKTAKAIDDDLMTKCTQENPDGCNFSVQQLIEIAGMSVARAINYYLPQLGTGQYDGCKILCICGPGNNGGDGLVAMRNLASLWNMKGDFTVLYPKRGKGEFFQDLVIQCQKQGIKFINELPSGTIESLITMFSKYEFIIDAIFGYGFDPDRPIMKPFDIIIDALARLQHQQMCSNTCSNKVNLISIDVPSGWNPDKSPPANNDYNFIHPDLMISLVAPKICTQNSSDKHEQMKRPFSYHCLSRYFVPLTIRAKYHLDLYELDNCTYDSQIIDLCSNNDSKESQGTEECPFANQEITQSL